MGFVDFIRSILFGRNMKAVYVVIVLEWILAAYGIGMTVSTKHLFSKILNLALTVLWVVCAIFNMVEYL